MEGGAAAGSEGGPSFDTSTRVVAETLDGRARAGATDGISCALGGAGAEEEDAPSSRFVPSEEQLRVVAHVENGRNVFFTGSAGVGKARGGRAATERDSARANNAGGARRSLTPLFRLPVLAPRAHRDAAQATVRGAQ